MHWIFNTMCRPKVSQPCSIDLFQEAWGPVYSLYCFNFKYILSEKKRTSLSQSCEQCCVNADTCTLNLCVWESWLASIGGLCGIYSRLLNIIRREESIKIKVTSLLLRDIIRGLNYTMRMCVHEGRKKEGNSP